MPDLRDEANWPWSNNGQDEMSLTAEILAEADAEHPGVEPQAGRQMQRIIDDPIIYPVIAVGVLLTTAFPIFLGQQLCLPIANGLVIFPFFALALRAGRPRRAIQVGLFWAVCQAAAAVAASLIMPIQAGDAIAGGLDFRSEIYRWIASGQGPASSPAAWLPQQLRDLALFAAATLVSGGLGGLILIARSLNMASFSVAGLLEQAARSGVPILLLTAYPIWSIVRLAGYLTAGAVLAEPGAVLDLRPAWWQSWWQRRWRLLAIGLGLIALGIALQWLLAPLWPPLLRAATGLE